MIIPVALVWIGAGFFVAGSLFRGTGIARIGLGMLVIGTLILVMA